MNFLLNCSVLPEWWNLPLPAGRLVYTQPYLFDKNRKRMYSVYAIKSIVRNYIYIGISNNIERRLEEHNSGNNRTTKPYRPFKLLLTEVYPNRPEARKREKYLKSGSGRESLKNI